MLAEAQLQMSHASLEFERLVAERPEVRSVLGAHLRRALGELLLRRRAYDMAGVELTEAARLFGEIHDWSAQDETMELLRIVDAPIRSRAEQAPTDVTRRAAGRSFVPNQRRPSASEQLADDAAPDLPRQGSGTSPAS